MGLHLPALGPVSNLQSLSDLVGVYYQSVQVVYKFLFMEILVTSLSDLWPRFQMKVTSPLLKA